MTTDDAGAAAFRANDLFRRWALAPDAETNAFWENYALQHPDQRAAMLHAKALLIALHETDTQVPVAPMWAQIRARTGEVSEEGEAVDEVSHEAPDPPGWWARPVGWLVRTAVVVAVGGVGWWGVRELTPKAATYQNLKDISGAASLAETSNPTAQPLSLTLSDSSVVTLQPGSRVSYATALGPLRQVFLLGDAHFAVRKDARHPFVVYANGVVARVVGTQFWVRAQANAVTVEVTSGCVAVSKVRNARQALAQPPPDVVLLANQRAVYSAPDDRLAKSLVANPQLVAEASEAGITEATATVRYVHQPVSKIFQEWKRTYNVEMLYDADALKDCFINASFTDEPFYERLEVICRVIRASYEVVETQVVIKSNGCQ